MFRKKSKAKKVQDKIFKNTRKALKRYFKSIKK